MSQFFTGVTAGSIGAITTLTGNSGGVVSPSGSNNIFTLGDTTTINITGNPGTNTLTANVTGGTDGQLLLASTAGEPDWASLASADGSVTFTPGANSLDLSVDAEASGSIITITGDSGGALSPTAGNITFRGGTTGLTFSGALSTETLDGTLNIGNGGTGSNFFTEFAVLCGGTTATAPIQSIASVGLAGEVLTSNGVGTLPTFQAITTAFSWSVVTGATQAMAVTTGYFANNAGTITFTLPATAAVGDTMEIAQMDATGDWLLAQNAGQTCYIGNTNTTTGAGGSLASTDKGDAIRIVCRVANTDFQVSILSGNITVV
jgi:hypothetical protein